VTDDVDNCPAVANVDQANNDGDAEGDVCDLDDDNDTVGDNTDNCPLVANTDQADEDEDGIGDACEEEEPPVRKLDGDCGCRTPASRGSSLPAVTLSLLVGLFMFLNRRRIVRRR